MGPFSPLREAEQCLHPFGVLVVVPLFVFFNAGIAIDGSAVASLWTPAPLGIVAGLFVGKQAGIFGSIWLAVRLGVGELPRGVSWTQAYGATVLAGIGFTMSIFVASLAFPNPVLVVASKVGISAFAGLWVLHYSMRAEHQRADGAPG